MHLEKTPSFESDNRTEKLSSAKRLIAKCAFIGLLTAGLFVTESAAEYNDCAEKACLIPGAPVREKQVKSLAPASNLETTIVNTDEPQIEKPVASVKSATKPASAGKSAGASVSIGATVSSIVSCNTETCTTNEPNPIQKTINGNTVTFLVTP